MYCHSVLCEGRQLDTIAACHALLYSISPGATSCASFFTPAVEHIIMSAEEGAVRAETRLVRQGASALSTDVGGCTLTCVAVLVLDFDGAEPTNVIDFPACPECNSLIW